MMQAEVAVTMGRGPATAHGHGGRLIGWFRRGGFPGDDRKPVGLVEFADGTVGGYGAKDVRHVGRLRGKAVIGQCIQEGDRR